MEEYALFYLGSKYVSLKVKKKSREVFTNLFQRVNKVPFGRIFSFTWNECVARISPKVYLQVKSF